MIIEQIHPTDLFRLLHDNSTIIIDVRERDEHAKSRIAGSTNIPLSQILVEVPNMRDILNKKIVLYCRAGVRSMIAAQKLQEDGFSHNIFNLTGGIIGWNEQQLPIVTSAVQ